MKVNKLTTDQVKLLGKFVKKKIAKEKGSTREIRDSVSLSSMKSDDSPHMAFIKPENMKTGASQLKKMGVKVEKELSSLGGYTAKVDSETTEKLQESGFKVFANPSVQIVPDMPVEASGGDVKSPKYALSNKNESFLKLNVGSPAIGIDTAHDMGYTGKGQGIAIIDTGVARHPDVNLVAFKDFISGKEGIANAFDDNGHGTHVAGVVGAGINNGAGIAGMAGGSRLLATSR